MQGEFHFLAILVTHRKRHGKCVKCHVRQVEVVPLKVSFSLIINLVLELLIQFPTFHGDIQTLFVELLGRRRRRTCHFLFLVLYLLNFLSLSKRRSFNVTINQNHDTHQYCTSYCSSLQSEIVFLVWYSSTTPSKLKLFGTFSCLRKLRAIERSLVAGLRGEAPTDSIPQQSIQHHNDDQKCQ